MGASNGQHTYGTKLFVAPYGTANPLGADPTGVGFTALGEIISINGLPQNPSVTKITHLNSDYKAHEKIPGFLDAGQITFRMNNAAGLMADIYAIAPSGSEASPDWGRHQFVVQFPDGSQWYCTAFVQGMPFEVPEDDRTTVEVTLEVSGRPIFV